MIKEKALLYHPKNHARENPHKLAYVIPDDGVAVTYQALDEESNKIAHVFRQLGLRVGSGVAFLMENRRGFFEICWAAQRAGLYYTPISTHLKVKEIAYIVTNCEAQVFIISSSYRDILAELVVGLCIYWLPVCILSAGRSLTPKTEQLKPTVSRNFHSASTHHQYTITI